MKRRLTLVCLGVRHVNPHFEQHDKRVKIGLFHVNHLKHGLVEIRLWNVLFVLVPQEGYHAHTHVVFLSVALTSLYYMVKYSTQIYTLSSFVQTLMNRLQYGWIVKMYGNVMEGNV